jgi:Fic family protein
MLSRADGMTRRIYSISAQIMAERRRYYEALEAAQKGEPDITTWLLWWLDCFERSLERAEQALDTLSRDVAFWRRHPASGFNERQRHVLRVLLAENTPTITSKRWAKLTGCAQITAIRDINDLLDKKALTPGASGGRSTAYHLVLPDDAKDAA